MVRPPQYSFQRYLAAKKSVDDRALNRHVWSELRRALPRDRELRLLEVGGGIGTMVERLIDWDLLDTATSGPAALSYTLLDAQPENIAAARQRVAAWGQERGLRVSEAGSELILASERLRLRLTLVAGDILAFADDRADAASRDLVVAHAVLDLLHAPTALPLLRRLLRPGGLLYASLTFDGVTAFEPATDPAFDALVERRYHETMDERITDGAPAGDRHAGRHLYSQLRAAGYSVLAMGASDWVVLPGPEVYRDDDAYFLHFIINTIDDALRRNPTLDARSFAAWIDERHAQIDRGELLYIAHQLDVLARASDRSDAQPMPSS